MLSIRRITTVACTALLCVPMAFAGVEKAREKDDKKEEKKTNAAAGSPAPGKVSTEDVMASLAELRALVEAQNRQIEAQQSALQEQARRMQELEARFSEVSSHPATPASTIDPTVAAAPTQDQVQQLSDRIGKVETNVAGMQKSTEGKLKQLGNFAFSGDFRMRYEPFFGGGTPPSPSPQQRNRFRVRARLNINAQFNDEFSGGVSLASGDETDPISTNQTLTSFFERKNFRLDRAFVKYTPRWAKPLAITGGKFGYTWVRTELTLDNDLNPEGLSEVLSFNTQTSVLKNITIVGFQLPFNESGGGKDSFMQGAQGQAQWALGSRTKLFTSVAFYDWKRADVIRAAQSSGGLSGSSNNNAATATQYASKFGIVDVIGRLQFQTGAERWPLELLFNYANNTRACDNLANIVVVPPATPPPCDSSDNHAYWAEINIGSTSNPRDAKVGYTFMRIERESVLGAFNFSDLRAPTNIAQHRMFFGYKAYKNVELDFTGLFGRQLVTATSPTKERILKRFQFDLIYKF